MFQNRCFIIPLHSDCPLNNIKVVFLLWNLVKQWKLALKKSHNLPHNSPILLHNLPWKYRTISDFLSHSIRWPAKRRLYRVSRHLTTGSLVLGLQSSFCRHPTTNCRLQDCTCKLNEGKNIAKKVMLSTTLPHSQLLTKVIK